MVNSIEETLNGGFAGLFGEVVTEDCYKLKELDFFPETIFDIGCNIGVFSRYARTLFPNALIVCVEPDADNWANFIKFTNDANIVFIKNAIGKGDMYKHTTVANGAHQYYVCEGLGYRKSNLETNPDIEKTEVEGIMIDSLIQKYAKGKCIIKIDCEGAETEIFSHTPSMLALKTMDYITIEIHNHAQDGSLYDGVKQKTLDAMAYFEETHNCNYIHPIFYATKK